MTNQTLNLDDITDYVDADEVVKTVLASGEFDAMREIGAILPYTRRVSINDLIPIEYQNQLLALDETMSSCFWQIGDITNILINSVDRERSKELGKLVSNTDVYEAVGYFCHRTARTIRKYYECARFFSHKTRAEYDVSFNIYVIARWVKDWRLMLQIALDNPQYSAEAVRIHYYQEIGEESPKAGSAESVETGSAEIPEDDLEDDVPSKYKAVILSKLDHTVTDLRIVLDRLPLSTEIRVRIGNLILEIGDISLAIRREA